MAWNPVTSISRTLTSQYLSTWTAIGVGTPQTERVVVLSNILALNKSLALLLSVISRQHRNNNQTIPVKDRLVQQFWQNQGSLWNMMFYLNVFYLLTLKDVVGHYKLWSEVMFQFTQIMCYNVHIPLLIRPDTLYAQKCRLMRFMLFMIKITKNPILYSL